MVLAVNGSRQASIDRVGDDCAMDEAWRRVKDELDRLGKPMTWLAQRLDANPQRVYNWKNRQEIPKEAYLEVAKALGKSPNWLAGIDAPGDELSPMQRQIVEAFSRIDSEPARWSAFTKIIEICALAADTPTQRPASPLASLPKRERAPDK